jgi:hypothetical protein
MRDSKPAQRLAKEQLKMMGPLTRDERVHLFALSPVKHLIEVWHMLRGTFSVSTGNFV